LRGIILNTYPLRGAVNVSLRCWLLLNVNIDMFSDPCFLRNGDEVRETSDVEQR